MKAAIAKQAQGHGLHATGNNGLHATDNRCDTTSNRRTDNGRHGRRCGAAHTPGTTRQRRRPAACATRRVGQAMRQHAACNATMEHMLRATCNWTTNGASLPIAPHGCGVPWQGRSCAPTGSPFRLFAMQQTTYNIEQTTSNRQRTTYSGRHAPITSPFSALALLHGTAACLSTRCRPRPCRDSLHGPWSAAARASASSCRRVACGGAVHGRGHLPALRMAAWSVAQCPRRRDRQRATDNVQQTTYGRQRAADNVQPTT